MTELEVSFVLVQKIIRRSSYGPRSFVCLYEINSCNSRNFEGP